LRPGLARRAGPRAPDRIGRYDWTVPYDFTGVPGHDLIEAGLGDLIDGVESDAALLVAIGAPRLRALGIEVPATPDDPEHRLYRRLAAVDSDAAHSRYNALIRRLVSFERALACAS
jgi:hypothetical protein